MFIPNLDTKTAAKIIHDNSAKLYDLVEQFNKECAHRRMAFADGQNFQVESEAISATLKDIIETSMTIDIVMASTRLTADEVTVGLMAPPKLEELLPSPVLMWNSVLTVIQRIERERVPNAETTGS